MFDLTPGTHEFTPQDFLELVQQYDQFSITLGHDSFLQIRVPTKWVKLETGAFGVECLTCRNKRKRDGHLFKINANRFIFEVECYPDHVTGKLKTNFGNDEFVVSMWKTPNDKDDSE